MANPLRIGIIGFGNIGSGVVKTLQENRELLDARCPRPLELRAVADVDIETERSVEIDKSLLTTESLEVIADPGIDVIVELTGTMDDARMFIETALRAGKHVVTANKALLANCGAELLAFAAEKGVRLLFEAAVGGGIPVVRALCDCLAANRIRRIEGILNGTCNFILDQMHVESLPFGDALAKAQEKGYAEPDPTADIEGMDAAHKIAILASLAFGRDIRSKDVDREGITKITKGDLGFLSGFRQRIVKHYTIAEIDHEGNVSVRARPMVLNWTEPLADVRGVTNGVLIEGTPMGQIVLKGPGAGPDPTSSAVISDLQWLSQFESGPPSQPLLKIPVGKKDGKDAHCYDGSEGVRGCPSTWVRILTRNSGNIVTTVSEIFHRNAVNVSEITEFGWSDQPDEPDARMTQAIVRPSDGMAIENVHKAVEDIRAAELSDVEDGVLALPFATM